MLKTTTGKYFCLIKKGYLGCFCRLLNKAKGYEFVKVKGKLVKTIGYWDHVDMSTCLFVFIW